MRVLLVFADFFLLAEHLRSYGYWFHNRVSVKSGEDQFTTRSMVRATVFEYIEVDYNRIRQRSANGYLSPEALEAAQVA